MTVYLVGAGPGDPGLITVRGAELLSKADVVLHDRLADNSLLQLVPSSATLINVGKKPGQKDHQDMINKLLVEKGSTHKCVVRLKGGDPFVFGRGGEEALALEDAGIPYEVVPGITSAVAVPAYAGIPITHREVSTSFTVVTGHRVVGSDDVNWEALAAAGGTIVVLMGVSRRSEIAARLMDGGKSPDTPVVASRWGTHPRQQLVRTTLGLLGVTELDSPATIVIGEVGAMELNWFEKRPLAGKVVVVTRATEQSSELSARLRSLGAEPLELPTIRIEEPSDGGESLKRAVEQTSDYEWIVFTSVNAVNRFMVNFSDVRKLAGCKIAVIGRSTQKALSAWHIDADLVPKEAIAEPLLAEFPDGDGKKKVLLPRAKTARDVLPNGLAEKGWTIDVVEAYQTTAVVPAPEILEKVRTADLIVFTSSSTVTNFVDAAGVECAPSFVTCIGPITAETAENLGLKPDLVAEDHSIDGLIDSLTRHFQSSV